MSGRREKMWIRVHNPEGVKLYVNAAQITFLQEHGNSRFKTTIWFSGADNNYIKVQEHITDVMRLIEEGERWRQ